MKYPTILALALSTGFLAACGGGGSDAPTGPVKSTLSFPLDAAYAKGFTTGVSLNGTAVDGADTYTMSLAITPAADEVFEGVLSKKSSGALTMKKNGAVLVADTISYYYSINPFTQTGARYSDGSYAVLTNNTGNYPTAAKVDDAGTIGTLTVYTDASKTAVKATSQNTWTLEADTATTAFACANSVIRDAAGTQTGTAAGCTKIDTNGNALGMRFTLSVDGKTLVFK